MTTPVGQTCPVPESTGTKHCDISQPAAGDGKPFAAIRPLVLQAAAERVASASRNHGVAAASETEVRAVLLALVRGVQEHCSGGGPASLDCAATPVGRQLLGVLRAAVLSAATETISTSNDTLATLGAIDAVGATIARKRRDDSVSRLTAPDALELVVEVAHDLRSPLTSILFLAETLQRGQSGDLNELQRRQLGLVYSAALGLSALASDVIELARGGDRLVDREPSPLSVNEIFQSVRDIVRPLAEEKRLAIRLVPTSTDYRVGHALALSRVLLNLTTNALKFTEEGFVELVAQEKGPAVVEFSVRDTGRGINPTALNALYTAFRRTSGHAGYTFSRTGLGLTICRRLVEALGSELQLETHPGWGTRFFFELSLPPAPHR